MVQFRKQISFHYISFKNPIDVLKGTVSRVLSWVIVIYYLIALFHGIRYLALNINLLMGDFTIDINKTLQRNLVLQYDIVWTISYNCISKFMLRNMIVSWSTSSSLVPENDTPLLMAPA